MLNGGKLALSGGSTLCNTGTLGVTVNGTAGTGDITGRVSPSPAAPWP